jgi:hypothetical protein
VQSILKALSSSTSDHCPLLLHSQKQIVGPPIFRFEAHWPLMLGFMDCIQQAWNKTANPSHIPMMTHHIKLSRTAKSLSTWAPTLIPQGKLANSICMEVINQLESTQESRELIEEEHLLKKLLKHQILGLANIERSRARQKSRLTLVKKEDVNTKYFQIMANVRKGK